MLQIENEYYSLVRPKQVPQEGETSSQALENRGIAHAELRVSMSIHIARLASMKTPPVSKWWPLYCLLQDSPALFGEEQEVIEQNQTEVVNRGRAPNAAILADGQCYPIEDWCAMHLQRMQPLAELLNQTVQSRICIAMNDADPGR